MVGRCVHGVPGRAAAAARGNRILDVGCGTGTASCGCPGCACRRSRSSASTGRSSARRLPSGPADGHNLRASFAAADACHLPFPDGTFDSTFCVAVLQHITDIGEALREFARVTRPGGRILAVEPDNAARYWYSSAPAGMTRSPRRARSSTRWRAAAAKSSEPRVGPRLPTLFADVGHRAARSAAVPGVGLAPRRAGSGDLAARAGRPSRRSLTLTTDDPAARRPAAGYLEALDRVRSRPSRSAGAGFVEIQSTLLFAVVGQRTDAPAQVTASPARVHELKAGRAGTTTRRSTTGRTRRPSARRDVRVLAAARRAQDGPVLELGCGTGRLTVPVARAGATRRRHRSLGADAGAGAAAAAPRACCRALLLRGDIRHLPFRRRVSSIW